MAAFDFLEAQGIAVDREATGGDRKTQATEKTISKAPHSLFRLEFHQTFPAHTALPLDWVAS